MRKRLSIIFFMYPFLNLSNNTNYKCCPDQQCQNVQCCTPQTNSCKEVFGKSFYTGRNQGNNFARKIMGLNDKTHLFGKKELYAVASLAIEYQQTFKDKKLAKWFTPNGECSMTYGLDYETAQTGTGTFDINAINFGVTSSGTIQFCPSKNDLIADIFVYVGLDEFVKGFWFSIDLPINRTQWDLNIQDCLTGVATSSTYPENSVGEGEINVKFRSNNPMAQSFASDEGFGDVPKLNYGRICGAQSTTMMEDIRMNIGYDFINCPSWLFSAAADIVVPTGTAPKADYMFNSVSGNCNRWEAGLYMLFRKEFCRNYNTDKKYIFTALTNINHIFAHKNERTLGLKIPESSDAEQNWSQYLILKKFDGANQATSLERAANITTGNILVGASVVANLLALLELNCTNYFGGLGYEFWARSKEKSECILFAIKKNTYAIKGSTQWNGDANDSSNNEVSPTTTISKNGAVVDIADNYYLSNDDLNVCTALHPSAYSNKIFGYFGKNWYYESSTPFLLFGAEAEFGQSNRAFSQWGVIMKFGLGF